MSVTLAVDFGGTRIKLGLVENQKVLASRILAAKSDDSLSSRLQAVKEQLLDMLHQQDLQPSPKFCRGVAVSYPSIINRDTAVIEDNFGKFRESATIDLRSWARESFGLPLAVENDARVALRGEWHCGRARDASDFLSVVLGTGIGVAAVQQGRLVEGPHWQAGIIGGHITVNSSEGARPCTGNRGCAEEEARVSSLKQHPAYAASTWAQQPQQDYAALFVCAFVNADPPSRQIAEHALAIWGALLVSLVHCFDPSLVVLGGGVLHSAAHILPWLQAYVDKHAHTPWGRVALRATELHESAALLGCEQLLLNDLALSPSPSSPSIPSPSPSVDPVTSAPAWQLPKFQDYDKFPFVSVPGHARSAHGGWSSITHQLQLSLQSKSESSAARLVVETYPGVLIEQLLPYLRAVVGESSAVLATEDLLKPPSVLAELLQPWLGDDVIFGRMNPLTYTDLFDAEKVVRAEQGLLAAENSSSKSELSLIIGPGAGRFARPGDCLVMCDLARWEAQLRFRRAVAGNLGARNALSSDVKAKYKRAYFVDWRVADRSKFSNFERFDFFLDSTGEQGDVKLVTGAALRAGLRHTASQPFRVVPFFDPAPWGGQWMRKVCDLDPSAPNYGWCFDCVPEENSLLLRFGSVTFEIPSLNLVHYQAEALLGRSVVSRFGAEFPIRFDFLDTMDGGNLSLQVHPLTAYIKDQFGMSYTQDESYYMLDCGRDATVYLGLKDGPTPEAVAQALTDAQATNRFAAEQYVNVWPAAKHDHFLIPCGTVHCSGRNSMVLEISATPYIFTFKLWDWDRLGLDGKPRPIHLAHGLANIQWQRRTEWTRAYLVNNIVPLARGPGWREERTGLHELEFIEVRRHWFSVPVRHETAGTVHVLNLVEGSAALVSSPSDAFAPFLVHYAETFIVPAAVGSYVIAPAQPGALCATVKAYVRS